MELGKGQAEHTILNFWGSGTKHSLLVGQVDSRFSCSETLLFVRYLTLSGRRGERERERVSE